MNLKLTRDKLLLPNTKKILKKCQYLLGTHPDSLDIIDNLLTCYKERISKVNEIVVRDVGGSVSISLVNHILSEGDMQKLTNFLEDAQILNVNRYFEEQSKLLSDLPVKNSLINAVKTSLFNFHKSFLIEWDKRLKHVIIKKIDTQHKEKCKLSFGIFNFSNFSIPENDMKILSNGKNMIYKLNRSSSLIKGRIIQECIEYASRFRQYIEKNSSEILVKQTDFKAWLQEAINLCNNDSHRSFYSRLLEELKKIKKEYFFKDMKTCSNESTFISKFDYDGFLWLEADKNQGFALLSVETMRKAELSVLQEFKGVNITLSKAQLISDIKSAIYSFLHNLDGNEKSLFNDLAPNFLLEDDVEIPFLNLKPKIHK